VIPFYSGQEDPRIHRNGGIHAYMGRSLPCIQEGCSICCRETTMPITKTEARRLIRRSGLAEDKFCYIGDDGIRRLLNNEETKACVFLATNSSDKFAPGICTVYDGRPYGCQSYPYVLDESDKAVLDDLCPHTAEFDAAEEEHAIKLLELEEKLKQ